MEYLSDAWFEAASNALEAIDTGEVQLVVEQRITEEEGSTGYTLVLAEGRATIDRSGARSAGVTISQSRDTAAAIRAGELNALEAIQSGAVVIDGDPRQLISAAEVLGEIDTALSRLHI